jgi:tetratricopeptide (TPR) repeat protein
MRCLYQKADMLVMKGRLKEAVVIMEEMLELNENDNQGVRFPLMSALIQLGETEKFKKYDKRFADDVSTSILYSRALFAFKTKGDSANACGMLKKALESNPFVIEKLFDENFQLEGVESYSPGSAEEAEVYLVHGFFAWHKTKGALEWLINTIEKITKEHLKRRNRR